MIGPWFRLFAGLFLLVFGVAAWRLGAPQAPYTTACFGLYVLADGLKGVTS